MPNYPDLMESFAIRTALGNNGGTWAEHYTEAQKEHWRQFVRDLIVHIKIGLANDSSPMPDKDIETVGDLIEKLRMLPPERRVMMRDTDSYETTLWVDRDDHDTVWIGAAGAPD